VGAGDEGSESEELLDLSSTPSKESLDPAAGADLTRTPSKEWSTLFNRFQGSTDARMHPSHPSLESASRAKRAAGGSGAVGSNEMDEQQEHAGEEGEAEGFWEVGGWGDEALSADELADVEGW